RTEGSTPRGREPRGAPRTRSARLVVRFSSRPCAIVKKPGGSNRASVSRNRRRIVTPTVACYVARLAPRSRPVPMTEPRVSPESLSSKSSPPWLLFGIVIALVVVSLVALATDAGALYRVANRVEPRLLLFPLVCTILSYTAMAASYQRIAATAGLELGLWDM